MNKPHSLDDRYANSDSGGCSTSVDDSIGRVSHIDCSGFDIPKVSHFTTTTRSNSISLCMLTLNPRVSPSRLSARLQEECDIFFSCTVNRGCTVVRITTIATVV